MTKTTVGSQIDGEKKAKLIEKVSRNGKNVNQVLEELIDEYLGNQLSPGEKAEPKELAPVLGELREFRKRFEDYWEGASRDADWLRDKIREVLEEIKEAKEGGNGLVRLEECDWSISGKLENLRQVYLNEGKEFVDPKTFEVYTKDEIE